MSDLVSIIMPSYNTARYIKDSIDSVIAQTYQNWELIIIDDCSTDDSIEIINSYRDPRIRLLTNEKNSGAAISRNYGLREAKGRYIAFLDSDDLWTPEKLEKQLRFMQEHGYDFSYTDYEKIDENNLPLNVYCTGPAVVTKRKMYRYCYPGCLTVMYNAEKIGLVQIKDIKKNNDYAMWIMICKNSDCHLYKESLAQYRIRRKSISHDSVLKKLRSHYDLFRYCDERSAFAAFWYACRNMFYGFLKKIKYEKAKR